MEVERPLILYQLVEVETLRHGAKGETETYVSARQTFADEQRAEQERKEMLKAESEANEDPRENWYQLDYRVSVEELKVSPRTIEEADMMDKERYESVQKATDAVMLGLLRADARDSGGGE